MFGLITLPLVINNALLGWGKRLKSSKCLWGQCVLVMRAIFRIWGNESHPGLQIVEKKATPLVAVTFLTSDEASFKGWWWGVGNEYESKRTLTRTKWLQVWTFPERSGCRNKGTWKTNPCREAKEIKTTGSCYEKMYFFFHLSFPKLNKQILTKTTLPCKQG